MRYYLDTSIWLDLFEDRNEPNFQKGKIAEDLLRSIILLENAIVVSDVVIKELCKVGYSMQEAWSLFERFRKIILFVRATPAQVRRAKDIAAKRDLPIGDALHALIAQDTKATLVSFDNHFAFLKDITHWRTPKEIISQEN